MFLMEISLRVTVEFVADYHLKKILFEPNITTMAQNTHYSYYNGANKDNTTKQFVFARVSNKLQNPI